MKPQSVIILPQTKVPLTMHLSHLQKCSLSLLLLIVQQIQAYAGILPVDTTVSISPPQVTFTWTTQIISPALLVIERRPLGAVEVETWQRLATLANPVKTFTDTGVALGNSYEYRIFVPSSTSSTEDAMTTVCATLQAPLEDTRGGVILVTDTKTAAELAAELALFELDLAGDGWFVKRLNVEPIGIGSPVVLKDQIKNLCQTNPQINSLILFGNVPVVRSGLIAPDGHAPVRAHETDTYYADLDGVWTDTVKNVAANGSAENENIPGDGKFDQNGYPTPLELRTGRITFSKMTATRKQDQEYLRDYIHKNHAWRHAQRAVNYKGLNNDYGFMDVVYNWMTGMFGPANVSTSSLASLQTESRLFAFSKDVPSMRFSTQSIFMANFRSWRQHWYRDNAAMMLSLAQPDWGLNSMWGSRPCPFLHSMAAGKPIGYGFITSQNDCWKPYPQESYYYTATPNISTLYGDSFGAQVSTNLLGDPTLRMHPVAPPVGLVATKTGAKVKLTWNAPSVPATGYHVYRSTQRAGSYQRLTASPITGRTFTDSSSPAGEVFYQVRAVGLTSVRTGTYLNQSQGIFLRVSSAGAVNRAPTASNAILSTKSNTPLSFQFGGSDPDGDSLTPILLQNPTSGQIRWSNGKPFYISSKDFTGLETAVFVMSDGVICSEPAKVTFHVTGAGSTLNAWNFSTGSGTTSPDVYHPAGMKLSTLSSLGFSLKGIVASNGQYSFSNLPTALTLTKYVTWTVEPEAGYRANLSRLLISMSATAGKSIKYELRASADNFATYTTVPLELGQFVGPGLVRNLNTVDLANLSQVPICQALQGPVAFRLYFWRVGGIAGDAVVLGNLNETTGQVDGMEDLVITGSLYPAGSQPLALVSAVSRKTDAAAGQWDLPLPLAGNGIEPRRAGPAGHTVVFTFNKALPAGAGAFVQIDNGTVAGTQVNNNVLSVTLTGLANATRPTVLLNDIEPDFKGTLTFGVLEGDVNQTAAVNSADLLLLRSFKGQAVSPQNWICDLDASGSITAADESILAGSSGKRLP